MNDRTRACRICPGRDLALQTIYLVVACVLSVFNIEPALDEDGNPRMPKIEFDGAVVRYVFAGLQIRTAIDIDDFATSH